MIDFSSILLAFGLLFGVVAGNAALNGDTLRVQIDVPTGVGDAGFTENTAEALFLAEAARLLRGESIIPTPTLRMQTNASVVSAVAKPLNLDWVVTAMQNQLGIDYLMVSGSILAEANNAKTPIANAVRPLTPGTKLDMVVIVVQPQQSPVHTVLEQPDGDVTTLVKRAATWSMEQVSPYRVALAHFLAGVQDDQRELGAAEAVAQRFVAQPWNAARAAERALTHDLLGLMALYRGEPEVGHAQLELAQAIPDVPPQAQAMITLNHAFIALSQREIAEAQGLMAQCRREAAKVHLPGFMVRVEIQEALLAWANNDLAKAEKLLRDAIAKEPHSEVSYHYLAKLLRAKGDAAGATAAEASEKFSRLFPPKRQALAVQLFFTDPINGGLTRR